MVLGFGEKLPSDKEAKRIWSASDGQKRKKIFVCSAFGKRFPGLDILIVMGYDDFEKNGKKAIKRGIKFCGFK